MTKELKKVSCVVAASACVFAYANNVYAEEVHGTYELDPIVITATRTPVSLNKVNANVNLITKEDIERYHFHDISQALKTVPGIDMVNFGDAGFESANAIRINGTDQILILVDGIRANVGHLSVPINQMIDMDAIEKIEVVKGSSSVLYGSGAKGGVINIITKKPDSVKTKLSTSFGNFSRENYRLTHQGAIQNTYWMLNLQKDILGDAKDGHGDRIKQHLNAKTGTIKIGHKFSDKADAFIAYDRYKSDTYNFGSRFGTNKNTGKRDSSKLMVNYKQKLSKITENEFIASRNDYDYTYQGNRFHGKSFEIKDQVTSQVLPNDRLSAGVEFYSHKFDNYSSLDSVAGHNLKETSVYLENEWDISRKFNLTAGARYTHHSQAGSRISPSANFSFQPNDSTRMYVAYNSHFIAPSALTLFADYGMEFMGMYFPLFLPNPDLKPEKGHTVEFGITHDFDKNNRISAHVYNRRSKDVIEMVTDPMTFADQAKNIDKEEATGFDIQYTKKFGKRWGAFAGYTYTKVDSSAYHGKNRDGMIPKGTLNIGATYLGKNYDISLDARYVIDRDGPYRESFPKNNYLVCNLSANYNLNKSIKAFVRINNIFDNYYAEQSNYTGPYGTPYDYYTAPGRNFVLGMEYSF